MSDLITLHLTENQAIALGILVCEHCGQDRDMHYDAPYVRCMLPPRNVWFPVIKLPPE